MMHNFNAISELDGVKALAQLAFPIKVDHLVTEQDHVGATLNQVIVEDSLVPIGAVSKKKKFLMYADLIKIATDHFAKVGDFKLIDSQLNAHWDMFQDYIFDVELKNPKSEHIVPMITLVGSYLNRPAEFKFGFWNESRKIGLVLKSTIPPISYAVADIPSLPSLEISKVVKHSLTNYANLETFFEESEKISASDFLEEKLHDTELSLAIKKALLKNSVELNLLEINKIGKIREEDFSSVLPIYKLKGTVTKLDIFWAMCTAVVFKSKSPDSRLAKSSETAEVFGL
jgi:hypothetical protein